MQTDRFKIRVYCPLCKKRALDTYSPIQGEVRIKCPHCNKFIALKLSYKPSRGTIRYRLVLKTA